MIRHERTTQAVMNDTLDSIAYRIYGDKSNHYLPKIIVLNPNLSPYAILPINQTIILPKDDDIAPKSVIKIWD